MNDNYNFRGEVIKEYEMVESAIRDLRKYVEYDEVYEEYKNNKDKKFNDFEIFCINHIKSIQKLIDEYYKLKKEMEKINND
jgi:hypothetical protein